jgi:hypothetical protein
MTEEMDLHKIAEWYLNMDVPNLQKAIRYEPSEFTVTPEYNEQYLYGTENYDKHYLEDSELGEPLAHPGLLLNQANVTRSPNFKVFSGVVSVHTRSEVEFVNPGRVGQHFQVTWEFSDMYKHKEKLYGVVTSVVSDDNGNVILRRHDHGLILIH